MNVLVFNVGSTTLKFALIDSNGGSRIHSGMYDRIGQDGGDAIDHVSAVNLVLNSLDRNQIDVIAHRVVHGGERFTGPTNVDSSVLESLAKLDHLAPLHNPAARRVVEALVGFGLPQTLVFDTAYYSTLEPEAYRYALPETLYQNHHVRRYGFHGTSHQWITRLAIEHIEEIERSQRVTSDRPPLKLVSLHLGGGCSATASLGGVAVDTSMGMTPLEGLVMASRCGDIDPAIVLHLIRDVGLTVEQVDNLLNKQSGLMGLCGDSDMRTVLSRRADGDPVAELAVKIYVRRIAKTIGGFIAMLGGIDGLIFSAGVGEHSCEIRSLVVGSLECFGARLDTAANDSLDRTNRINDISAATSRVKVLVIATDEELAIARQVS
ncbi:acetate/propionate family kinase [Neorhodopirellula pilleata]|uniref:Acetate kinase n=1 Tax=Neorhodopirellula pilleata TaxID=2714738 RepID=A0A5C6A0W5_9BACT|nr:acetate/propionate family kinase [Neorhodopirellula pilleata]TWT93035.1 Acetate kinase [Neorhodopirellula pilleata]